ncbi:pilus assembly protein TadG-related protein [Vallitalea okinawensis]|uniref:pilus assembly protein TadG-related protein n=1 Tax=Vallitalea okinawensis TaxID=2078660 RepID=UPI000CFB2369|nr:Tad domain-containing protein [Vallitalea okinawensis]
MKVSDEQGNVAIILCIVIAVLFGFMAYVMDIGMVYSERMQLSNAIDSAVLAAALELPKDRAKAMDIAEQYLVSNNVSLTEANIVISEDDQSIEITTVRDVEHFFAPVLGIEDSTINLRAKAIVGPVKSVTGGIRPFAIELFEYSYGDEVTLKEGAGGGYHGNYGAVALGGRGACVFKKNSLYGYEGTISIGDEIDTEPGNMSGAVKSIQNYINADPYSFENFERDSRRIWTVPIVDSLDVNGRKEVTVIGFAQVFVEDIKKKSGKMEIDGRFMQYVANGEVDKNAMDTGTYAVKLDKLY